jgi:hypothetical protein
MLTGTAWRGDPSKAIVALEAAAVEQTPELTKFKLAQMKRYELVTGGDAKLLGVSHLCLRKWHESAIRHEN